MIDLHTHILPALDAVLTWDGSLAMVRVGLADGLTIASDAHGVGTWARWLSEAVEI